MDLYIPWRSQRQIKVLLDIQRSQGRNSDLQEKQILPVGGVRPVKVDIRIICASNADMENLVREGLFREDLYYRLNVVEIHLPLLRDRGKDVELLIHHFVERFSLEHGKRIMGVSPDAMGALKGWQYILDQC